MSDEIDYSNLPDFPKRIPEKLRTIRERLRLSPDQIAPRVGAKSGAEILSYDVVGLCETFGKSHNEFDRR